MTIKRNCLLGFTLCLVTGLAVFLIGCSADNPNAPSDSELTDNGVIIDGASIEKDFAEAMAKRIPITWQDGSEIPAEIADVVAGDEGISFWPYTGTDLSESPVDPINVVFKGQADPVQIREALMSLGGDRSPVFPDMPPFNLPWTDAVGGDVQTTYLTDGGWEGCVIQLTLGEYTGLRVHLRLFATGLDDGEGGTWALGGAHFEMMIPGTSEHQVLSWELAEAIVTFDLARSGLLAADPMPTGMINAAPSFRGIPTFIYNPLVEDPLGQMLLSVLGYPVVPQTEDYPLPSNGEGTLLNLGGTVPIDRDFYTNSVVIEFDQAIPRPVCSAGPYDWLYVTGPITFTTRVHVGPNGRYRYLGSYDGVLAAVPIDIATFEPIGEPFDAQVTGKQSGMHSSHARKVMSFDRRLALQQGEPEMFFENLQVGTIGHVGYKAFERCFDGE